MHLAAASAALRHVFPAWVVVSAAVMVVYAFVVPNEGCCGWMVATAVMPAMVFRAAFVRMSRHRRPGQVVKRLVRPTGAIADSKGAVRMSALLFEAGQVSANAVRVCGGPNDKRLYDLVCKTNMAFEVLLEAASSGRTSDRKERLCATKPYNGIDLR